MLTHKQLRTKGLGNAGVKAEFEKLGDEFALLDEFLKARAAQGLAQAQVAEKSAPHSLRWRSPCGLT